MTGPHESPLLLQWGRHRRRRRAPLPRLLWGVLGTAALGAAAFAVWIVVRPHPWRPPSGHPSFSACTSADGAAAWCGRVLVPEDPRDPDGPTIALRVLVLPATARPAAGALFYLEGGPAVAASDLAESVYGRFAEIGRDRDLVLVDQRGTGGSNALACRGGPSSCFARLGDRSRLYTTSVAADDLEAVRRALGYDRIDLYGVSYGATLAQIYADRYPASVRSMVLDGGSLLDVRIYDASARNAERALDADLARCARDTACAKAFPHPRRDLATILVRPPRRVMIETGTVTLRPDDVAWTVNALSQSVDAAATIPFVVHEAARGDYLPLARAFATEVGTGPDPRSRLATFWTIICSEPWAAFDPYATALEGRGSYLDSAAVARARFFLQACRSVPRGRVGEDEATNAVSHAPTLLLAGSNDPLDPPAALRGWWRAFPDGRLLVVPNGAHGAMDDTCVQSVVARFVARGRTAGLNTACVRRIAPPPFVTG